MNDIVNSLRNISPVAFEVGMEKIKGKREDDYFEAGAIVYTPISLIDEIFDNIPAIKEEKFDVKIAVVYTIEMAFNLVRRRFTNITMIVGTHDEKLKGMCDKINIKYIVIEIDEEQNMPKFDVVVGNPPYQDSNKTNSDKLWPIFIEVGLSLLKKDGVISFITPDTWTSGTRSVCATGRKNILADLFLTKKLAFISFDVAKFFPGTGSTFSYWIVKNNTQCQSCKTTIKTKDELFTADLSNLLALPKNINEIELDIFSKVVNSFSNLPRFWFKFVDGRDIDYTENKNSTHPYRYINVGYNYPDMYGDKPNRNNEPKIHLRYLGSSYSFDLDISGKLNIMHNGRIFLLGDTPVTETGVDSFFNSSLIKFLVHRNKRHHRNNEPKIINMIPLIDLTHTWTDDELYKHFELTNKEIKYIETNVE